MLARSNYTGLSSGSIDLARPYRVLSEASVQGLGADGCIGDVLLSLQLVLICLVNYESFLMFRLFAESLNHYCSVTE